MNSMASKDTLDKSLMEAIALLHMINQCPESPKDNQPPKTLTNLSAAYQLSLQREKEIVDNLAFLSATTNDPTMVMAVCLEEARRGKSCTIRLTSNTGDLKDIVNGFNRIARILERAASRGTHIIGRDIVASANDVLDSSRDDDINDLFRCVVTVDYFRILSRLRSRHAQKTKRKAQPILITSSDVAIHDQSIRPSSKITTLELKNIRAKVSALKALFQRFEDIPATSVEVQNVIMDLIIQIYELGSQTKLKPALESSSTLESSSKESLPLAVGKLGRYYSISHELVCAARSKKYSLFENIQISTSSIKPPSSSSYMDSNIDLITAIQDVFRPRTVTELRALRQSLESVLKKPIEDISDNLRVHFMDYYHHAKVHAEMQLLFFYGQNQMRRPPRAVCSSKSACYLCDLFFRIHGQFYLPRTHGRLYNKWTLPDWRILIPEMRRTNFDVVLMQFSEAVKVRIRAALKNGPVRVRHPNESVLVLPAYWSSSKITVVNPPISEMKLASHGLPQNSKEQSEVSDDVKSEILGSKCLTIQDSRLSELFQQTELLDPAAPSASRSVSTLHAPASETVTRYDKTSTSDTSIPPVSNSPSSSSAKLKPYGNLPPGETTWQPISCPNTFIKIGTTRLRLQLSYESGETSTISENSSPRWVRVKWLLNTELENIKAKTEVVDVDGLSDDAETTLERGAAFTSTELYLRRGDDVLSIKYAFGRKTEERKKAIEEENE